VVDEYGYPLESDPYATGGAPSDDGAGLFDAIINGQNVVGSIFTGAQDAIESVFLGAQNTLGGLGDDASAVVINAQDTIGGAVEEVANPLSLAGLGLGLGLGGTAVTIGAGLAAAFAADQLLAGGTGTTWLLRKVAGRRRR
jgi:hypothetical protein